jgi:hypothetical protein
MRSRPRLREDTRRSWGSIIALADRLREAGLAVTAADAVFRERRRRKAAAGAGGLLAVAVRRPGGDRTAVARCRLRAGSVLVGGASDYPQDVSAFVPTSIPAAHRARLPEERRGPFTAAVVAGVRLPLHYVRVNASATRAGVEHELPPSPSTWFP